VGRFSATTEGSMSAAIVSISGDALAISKALSADGDTGIYNNPYVVLEPIANYPTYDLSALIGDPNDTTLADFGGGTFNTWTVENTNNLTTSTISDFYLNVPRSTGHETYTDPLTGLTTGNADYLGYFTMNPNGTMTFARAFSVTATVTNGTTPLKVVFSSNATNTSGATNWVWNFGNGTIITNTTDANVTNTYTTAGSYTVTLTLNGPNGAAVETVANYVVVSTSGAASIPAFSSVLYSNGQLILNGTNGTANTQYWVLCRTNLSSGIWLPIFTNNFSSSGTFSYTNMAPTNASAFYRLVSP
jgi:PKD repeat protein